MSARQASATNDGFTHKTYQMVNAGHPEITWDETGTLIVVTNAERLAADILPLYFRHNQYASWVRALNAHDFKKSGSDRWQHPFFVRGKPELLPHIRRKQAPRPAQAGSRSRASSATTAVDVPSSSTAIVRVPKRAFSPGRPDRFDGQLSTVDGSLSSHHLSTAAQLQEERKRLWLMQEAMSQLEGQAVDVQEETFRQRFDTVRLMHMMLQRLRVVNEPSLEPSITLNPGVLQHPHGQHGLPALAPPKATAAGLPDALAMAHEASETVTMTDADVLPAEGLSTEYPLTTDDVVDLTRMAEHFGLGDFGASGGGSPTGDVQELVTPGAAADGAPPKLVSLSGTPPQIPSETASQLAAMASRLPQIPPDLLRDVSFDKLPPAGTEQRQQVEAAVNWYFQQLSIHVPDVVDAPAQSGAATPFTSSAARSTFIT